MRMECHLAALQKMASRSRCFLDLSSAASRVLSSVA
jgi:hypothetical protein